MPLTCCIEGCSETNKGKKVTLFALPKNPEFHKKWMDVMSIYIKNGHTKRKSLRICELHFAEQHLDKWHKTLMPDGTLHLIQRQIPLLLSTAVPCVFDCQDTGWSAADKRIYSENLNLPSEKSSIKEDRNIENEIRNYTFNSLVQDVCSSELPQGWSCTKSNNGLILVETPFERPPMVTFIDQAFNITIRVLDLCMREKISTHMSTYEDFCVYLKSLSKRAPCIGIGDLTERRSANCEKIVQSLYTGVNMIQRCAKCSKYRRNEKKNQYAKTKRATKRKLDITKNLHIFKKKCARLEIKNAKMQDELADLKSQYEKINKNEFMNQVLKLPKNMQAQVKTCFEAANVKGKSGRRYSTEWIYECFLLRVKGRSSYEYLRKKDIMPLPTIDTLNKYIKNMKAAFGFNEDIFECLHEKTTNFSDSERHGVLLVDEIKLSTAVKFDKETLRFVGFTDLGAHTPEKDKDKQGDHALVIMYQPFRGNWVQTLGAFLSRGCATGPVLHKILLECVLMTERSGLFVDGIVTDGATWNRNMWKCFGVDKEETTCIHPYDEARQLYFFSDFPHLIKCLRNCLIASPTTWTPDGVFKLSHYEAVIEEENKPFNLKIAHKLSKRNINPKFYEKMNVALAFQLFSPETRAAMKLLKPRRKELEDCEGTLKFAERISDLITAMMTRSPLNSLSVYGYSYKTISDFLDYLFEWEVTARENDLKFLTHSTSYGLKITLTNSLKLIRYLSETSEYQYLMTSRLTQDALESFFGMIRNACGCNDHPDPTMFIQVYRLLSLFSLVKPPRGSNVEGLDIFHTLMETKQPPSLSPNRNILQTTLDTLVENSTNNLCSTNDKQGIYIEELSYTNLTRSNVLVVSYMAGYVARKINKHVACDACLGMISDETPFNKELERNKMISEINKGWLLFPSDAMFELISHLENTILGVVGTSALNTNTFMDIVDQLSRASFNPIGCPQHQEVVTKYAINFYIICRAHFICREYNKLSEENRQKTKLHRKQARCS